VSVGEASAMIVLRGSACFQCSLVGSRRLNYLTPHPAKPQCPDS
jgi:hypothetical protein